MVKAGPDGPREGGLEAIPLLDFRIRASYFFERIFAVSMCQEALNG